MARIKVVAEQDAQGPQLELIEQVKSRYGGVVPGIMRILLADLQLAEPVMQLYQHLHLRRGSPLTRLQREMLATVVNGMVGGMSCLGLHSEAARRLTEDAQLGPEFATAWSLFDLDPKTRALLEYAKKLNDSPNQVDETDIEALHEAGWDEQGVYEATALIGLFNFTARLEAAAGLPMDRVPATAQYPEAMPD